MTSLGFSKTVEDTSEPAAIVARRRVDGSIALTLVYGDDDLINNFMAGINIGLTLATDSSIFVADQKSRLDVDCDIDTQCLYDHIKDGKSKDGLKAMVATEKGKKK